MSLEIEIKSNSKQAEQSLKDLLKTIDRIPTSVEKSNRQISSFSKDVSKDLKTINQNVEQSGKSVEKTVRSLGNFAKITGGLLTGLLAAGGVTSLSSQFTELNNRIALTTGRTRQLVVQQQKLFGIARKSNSDLKTTVDLYSALVVNAGLARKEATELTETLIKAGKIGGGEAGTISSALVQLQQGLAAGTLRGQELNSVLEGTPRIAQAIAAELKTGVGQLKALAEEGKISAAVVSRALKNAKADIDKEFSTLEIPLSTVIADAGREFAIGLSRVMNSLFGGSMLTRGIQNFSDYLSNMLANLAVNIRILKTDFLLFRLSLESNMRAIKGMASGMFGKMVSQIISFTDNLSKATEKVTKWATGFGEIFYGLFMYVIGNSVYKDLIRGIIKFTPMIFLALVPIARFAKLFRKHFKGLLTGGLTIWAALVSGIARAAPAMVSSLTPIITFLSKLKVAVSDVLAQLAGKGLLIVIVTNFDKIMLTLEKVKGSVMSFFNSVTSVTVEVLSTTIAAAFLAGFALMAAGGGFTGSIGLAIATAFVGAVGAYFAGFAANFDMSSGMDIGAMTEISRNQEILLLTIAQGITSIVNGSASLLPEGGIQSAIKFVGDNILAVAVTLPILAMSIRSLLKTVSEGGSSLLNPAGSAASSSAATLGDVFQARLAGPFIRDLQGIGSQLNAELSGVKEAMRSQRLRLEGELTQRGTTAARQQEIQRELFRLANEEKRQTKSLIASIKENERQLAVNVQLLEGPVNRLREAVSKGIQAFARIGAGLGGTAGGFLGAGLGLKNAKAFGLTSAETMIVTLLGAQLGQVVGAALVGATFQSLGTLIQMSFSGIFKPLITSIVTAIATKVATAFLAVYSRMLLMNLAFATLIPRMRAALIAGAAAVKAGIIASAVFMRGAVLAGALAVQMALASGGILAGIGIGAGLGLLVAALFAGLAYVIYLFKDEIMAAGAVLMKYIRAGFDFLEDVGRKLGTAILDGMTWLTEAGTTFADAVLGGLSSMVDLAAEMGSTILSYIKSAFDFGGGDSGKTTTVKRATGGSVFGAGSATSDSIPAMLSNGEFVMRTSVASQHRPFLEQLNATGQLPGFATGGSVNFSPYAASVSDILSNNYGPIDNMIAAIRSGQSAEITGPQLDNYVLGELARIQKAQDGLEGTAIIEYRDKVFQGEGGVKTQGSVIDPENWHVAPYIGYKPIRPGMSKSEQEAAVGVVSHELQHVADIGKRIPYPWYSDSNPPQTIELETAANTATSNNSNTEMGSAYREIIQKSQTGYNYGELMRQIFKENVDFSSVRSMMLHLEKFTPGAVDLANDGMLNGNNLDAGRMGQGLERLLAFQIQNAKYIRELQKRVGSDSPEFQKEIGRLFGPLAEQLDFDGDLKTLQFATGGSVFGAGSATSDSIPAMLSNGEFVMRTSVANQHRPFLEQLNATGQLPGFATGGTVGAASTSGATKEPSFMSGILTSLKEMLRSLLGDENYDKVAGGIDKMLKLIKSGFTGFQGPDKASKEIFTNEQLISALTGSLPDQSIDIKLLAKELSENADLTKRLLGLNDSRADVEAKIAELVASGDKIPLELSTQLTLIKQDLVTELGKVAAILEDVEENTARVIPAIDTMASAATNTLKESVKGGITGLLKGEVGLEDFGKGLLDSFTGTVLETAGGGITEGIFNTADGESSGIGATLTSMFGDIGTSGFGLGESIGGNLGKLGTALNPMIVSMENKLGGLLGDEGLGDTPAVDTEGGLGSVLTAFQGKFSQTLDSFIPGLGGLFDSLIGSLGGVFKSIMGMFGGGGGDGIGSLLSMFGGFFNDGGLVPGGGQVPVVAHGGEMILNKRQQSNLFGQLQSRNSSEGQQTTVNLAITGDISRQTKKEILSMMPSIAQGVNQQNKEQNR